MSVKHSYLIVIMVLFLLGKFYHKPSFNNLVKFNQENRNVDSIMVKYWDNLVVNEYRLYYSDEILKIESEYFNFNKIIKNKECIQLFLNYINQFYINRDENIILKRKKRDYLESAEYPYITVIGYKNKNEVFNISTQIGEEEYDVEYNPKFLKFYSFLGSLVKKD